MLMPSIFGESLLDDFFGDDFGRTVPRNSGRYVTPSTTVMKTDIKEREDEFEIEIDLPAASGSVETAAEAFMLERR